MSQTATAIRPISLDVPPKITYEEFLERYDGVHAEWVDGEVELTSPVSDLHQEVSGFLLRVVAEFVEVHQLGKVRYENFQMKLITTPRGREPDILFIANGNLPQVRQNFLDGPADLVVEIVSPDSVERDRVRKFAEYQGGGVREYWLIDPVMREANFFLLDDAGAYRFIPADAQGIYRSSALEGFWLRVDWLWQSPSPAMSIVRKELGLP